MIFINQITHFAVMKICFCKHSVTSAPLTHDSGERFVFNRGAKSNELRWYQR